ncbi:tRNA guanosine(34) transglycosylase Tgt [Candidatus Wolfebacteria bacterium]|nr:MAG: tRNA guanosine(34) transglycosylase Tgt [Candidatus Wolfebacteria bacterium]
MSDFNFKIEKKLPNNLGRAGTYSTPHGDIPTPAFVTVGTKATIKSLSPEQVKKLGADVVLANTYHLYLQPGHKIVQGAGGLHSFMNWNGPIMTDSGGFQVFSLGAAFGSNVSKIASDTDEVCTDTEGGHCKLATIDEEGVTFKSHIDGSSHRFTPESSMQIQEALGADIIFAFDECTSPQASEAYQREAMDRTHRWAQRSLDEFHTLQEIRNKKNLPQQALFGIVQGGRHKNLREESARIIKEMRITSNNSSRAESGKVDTSGREFDGFGIGGSFNKEDMYSVVGWVNKILPEDKPRHLLGIGEPADIFGGVENGTDLFDCVAPTRVARNGQLHTKDGKINITNAKFSKDFSPIESDCECYTCKHYTRAYISHLFRAKEMFASTLASIHNLHFMVQLTKDIRSSIIENTFDTFKEEFLRKYIK